jgi:transcriptional regulator with XRE-family HTH domain
MKTREKEFRIKKDDDPTHVGNLIAWIIQQQHSKKKDVAAHLNILPSTLTQYFKQPSVQTAILWRLSKALNYNFLMYLGQKLDIEFETQKEVQLKQELALKEEQIKRMEIEIELFKKINKI